MYKTSGLFFLFFTRQTSKRALLLPCHASRGELKSSKKPKRPAPKAVARLKPGIERCSPDAWRSMAKHGDAWKQRNETKETSRSFEHSGNASRVCRVCGMMSDVIVLICIIFDFSQTFLQGPPAVLTSGHGVSAASHNLPHCAGVVSLRLTLHERRFMDTFQTWPGVWAKGHRDVRCTEPMRGRHQKWIEMVLKWIEMVHLDTMGEVALFKTRLHQRRLDHEAQERSRTDAQTHREHLKSLEQILPTLCSERRYV